jgi:1-acyl-sn-glycerol-3-phosphate acyltransferase
MAPMGLLRVAWRLLQLVAVTRLSIRRLRAERRRVGDCPHTALRHGHAWARRMTRALGVRVRVHGEPPAEPALLLANHRSYLDIPVLLAQLPCAFLAKSEVAAWPLFGEAARLHHTVFVEREDPTSRKRSREEVLRVLRRRVSFVAFPEGTTSFGPGLLPFYPGLFRLAAENDVPVVPVMIEYERREDCWVGADSFLGHFVDCFRRPEVRVTVCFGPALGPREVDDLRAHVADWILGRLEQHPRPEPAALPAPLARPRPLAV